MLILHGVKTHVCAIKGTVYVMAFICDESGSKDPAITPANPTGTSGNVVAIDNLITFKNITNERTGVFSPLNY